MIGPVDSTSDQRDPQGLWREAAAYARWTPSPHNIQPWRLRLVSEESAELYFDPRRGLPNTDPNTAFMTMSMVMYAEYLSVAFAARGFRVSAEYVEKSLDYSASHPVLFARLTRHAAPDLDHLAGIRDRDLLLRRKTSRLPYDGQAVPADVLRALGEAACEAQQTMGSTSDAAVVHDILDLNRRALFDDLNDKVSRTELQRWIRTTDAEAERTKDGLWAQCLRFPGWMLRDVFEHHEHWTRGARAALAGKLMLRGMRGTRTVVWWSGAFSSPADFIRCGQLLSRTWLDLAARDIHIHPFGSVVTNARAHAAFIDRLGESAPRESIWLIARVGRSAQPPRSYRLATTDILLDAKELG